MIGLVLCLMLDRHADAGLIAASPAIGVGFGGQETYGQTVGLSLLPADHVPVATLGFVVKGAVWGPPATPSSASLSTGAAPLDRAALGGFAIMIAGTLARLAVRQQPQADLLLQPVRPAARRAVGWTLARWPAAAGVAPLARALTVRPLRRDRRGHRLWRRRRRWPAMGSHLGRMPLGWWKAMELTFGALLGLDYVLCAWRLRHQLAGTDRRRRRAPRSRAVCRSDDCDRTRHRGGPVHSRPLRYTIAGTVLAGLVLFSETLAWQTGITADRRSLRLGLHRLPDLCSAAAALGSRGRHDRHGRGGHR